MLISINLTLYFSFKNTFNILHKFYKYKFIIIKMSEKNNKSENKIIKGEDISEIKKENNNSINLDFYNDITENQI